MRRIVILLFVSLLFCQSAYAGEIRSTGPAVIAERPAGEIKVVMYMAPWWPYCRKAREDLKSLGVNLIEYDIDKDESKKAEMKRIAGSTVIPVIDIEGYVIRGYAPDEIKRAVDQSRKAAR